MVEKTNFHSQSYGEIRFAIYLTFFPRRLLSVATVGKFSNSYIFGVSFFLFLNTGIIRTRARHQTKSVSWVCAKKTSTEVHNYMEEESHTRKKTHASPRCLIFNALCVNHFRISSTKTKQRVGRKRKISPAIARGELCQAMFYGRVGRSLRNMFEAGAANVILRGFRPVFVDG